MTDAKKKIADIIAQASIVPPLTLVEAELAAAKAKPKRKSRSSSASDSASKNRHAGKPLSAGGLEAEAEMEEEGAAGEKGRGDPARSSSLDGDSAWGSDDHHISPEIIEASALEPLNDVGNGKRLLHHFGDEILHVRDVGWHVFTGTHWSKEGGDEAVTRYAQLTASRIRMERTALTFTKSEQEAVEAGDDAEAALKALGTELLERSEEDRKAEEKRLAFIIMEGRAAKKALSGRKGARVKFAIGSGNTGKINGMITQALPHKTVPVGDLDKDPHAFNVENGTLRFVQMRDEECPDPDIIRLKWIVRLDNHARRDLISKCAPVAFDPVALCSEWFKFLERVQPAAHMRDFLRDYHGYGLTGSTAIQGLIFNAGGGANGKSTFIEAVMRLVGPYGDTLNPESFTGQQQKQGSQATPDIADLPGVRLLRVSELPEKAKLQEPLVKALTGGEPMKARHNYGIRFFTFYPVFKVSMSGNAKPDIYDISEGMWRRVMIVPWDVMIPKHERREFEEMQILFAAERPGILNWLIEGCLAFLNAGSRLSVPDEVTQATAEHRDDMDPIGQFLNSCCERAEGSRMQAGVLYAHYEAWCHASGLKVLHQTTFGKTVPKHGWVKVRIGVVYYLDMKMHPDAPPPLEPRHGAHAASGPRDPPLGFSG